MCSLVLEKSSHISGEIDKLYLSEIKLSSNILRIPNDMDINEMVESIMQHGLLNPILVRIRDENFFELVAGCRRYLACLSLGWKKIPCHIVHLNEMQTFEASLIENISRKSLSPLEEGNAFKTYTDTKGWGSIVDLSKKIGRSSSYITKRIALLDLPNDVLENIKDNKLKPSIAEELLSIKNSDKQSHLASIITNKNLTTINVRKMVREDPYYCENSEIIKVRYKLQSFNKSMITLRLAINRLSEIAEEEDNFIINELISYQISSLNNQIDTMLRVRKNMQRVFLNIDIL